MACMATNEHVGVDSVVWMGTSHGEFSTKYVYVLIVHVDNSHGDAF